MEKKGNLSYLSWAFAWAEFKKIYPEATYKVDSFDGLFCSGNEKMGYMVRTEVTADGLTYEMWLPVMDSRNKSILTPTSYDVNKAVMRCLTKNLAMFGLGLYIYAGEDLPDDGENKPTTSEEGKKVKSSDGKKIEQQEADDGTWRLSKAELVTAYEVESAEKAILYYEKALGGKPFAEWTKEETEVVREDLEKKLEKRKAQKKLKAVDGDLPFTEV